MTTYTAKEAKKLTVKTWTATGRNGSIQVKSILKTNAVRAIQKWDADITEDMITIYRGIPSSHQASLDFVSEIEPGIFAIQLSN